MMHYFSSPEFGIIMCKDVGILSKVVVKVTFCFRLRDDGVEN